MIGSVGVAGDRWVGAVGDRWADVWVAGGDDGLAPAAFAGLSGLELTPAR